MQNTINNVKDSLVNENYNYTNYAELLKPDWAPPAFLFGPVWSVLYLIIFITFGYVFYMYFQKQISFWILLPFILNLFFNAIFTPIQFGLKNNLLASIDIALIWLTLIWAMYAIYPFVAIIALANIPYLLWVSFATVLQFTITWMNR